MPVLDHEVSQLVIQKDGAKYGCWNRAEFREHVFASRWTVGGAMFREGWTHAPLSTECRYDMSLQDAKCEGCEHQGSGERYSQEVRNGSNP